MRIFMNRLFARFARKESISEVKLRETVDRAIRGLIDADLGSGIIKQRLSRTGQGRSSGYRSGIAIRFGQNAFFIYGFAKNEKEDLAPDELLQYRLAPLAFFHSQMRLSSSF